MYENLYKIVVIGDSGVGKSNIISRFTTNDFFINNKSTIGVEFGYADVEQEDGTIVKLQIWDTAGQERFRAITKGYYRGAAGAIIVFDITKMLTFKNVEQCLKELKEYISDDIPTPSAPEFHHGGIPILLLGNKIDVKSYREVPTDLAISYAKEHGFMYMETSALSGKNIRKSINSLSNTIYKKAIKEINQDSSCALDIPEGKKIPIGGKSTQDNRNICC